MDLGHFKFLVYILDTKTLTRMTHLVVRAYGLDVPMGSAEARAYERYSKCVLGRMVNPGLNPRPEDNASYDISLLE